MKKIKTFTVFIVLISISSFCETEEEWTTYSTVDGLISKQVFNIAIDMDNVKWIVQRYPFHLSAYDDSVWTEHLKDFHHLILSIAVSKDNLKWLGSIDNSIYSYDGKKIIKINENLFVASVQIVKVGNNNVKWFGTYPNSEHGGRIYTYDNKKIEQAYHGDFGSFDLDKVEGLWISNYDGSYLYYHNENVTTVFSYEDDFPELIHAHRVKVDHNNIIWAGVYQMDEINFFGGLLKFDRMEWTLYNTDNSGLARNAIYSIETDQNNVLWIGTDSGVSRFDGDTWTTFTTENSGLADNKVNAIAVEKNNTIWFGTDNGVSKYTGEVITTVVDEEETKPETLPLIRAYPNPFNPTTTIEFDLPETGMAAITIYNIAGQKVIELFTGYKSAGMHRVVWDGTDESGNAVSAGVYIARLTAGEVAAVGKMVLVR